jgi:hypothetical protein
VAFWNKPEKPRMHTNAPRHWPAVQLDQFDNPGLNLIAVGGQLAQLHAPPKSSIAFMRDLLYEDGILQVPIVIEEGGVKTCVFVYSTQDKDAAAHYSGVRTLLRSRENAAAVYYGPEPLAPTTPGKVLTSIDTHLFSKPDAPAQDADFSLWWATPEDPLFSQSADRALLDRWFEALDGFGYLLFTAFVNDLELIDNKQLLYALPTQPFMRPLTGPADTQLLLHASAPEGIFLAFDETKTSARTRHLLLASLSQFASEYRTAIDAKKLPVRAEETGVATWKRIRDQALAREAKGETGLTLHAVSVRDGQPARSPTARSTEDRKKQPRIPGREQLDFAMDLVDRVVARMKQQPIVQSSQQALGQPNLFPVVAVKANGHTWERQLPYEDGEVAEAAAGRVRDDWPDAEIVAVLLDAAIRENGVRTDVLRVKIEDQAGVAADLIQRYKTSDSGEIELIGHPSVMPTESFLLPATSPSGAPVDAGLAAFTAQAVEEIVKTLTVGEPSGMLSDDPEDPLTSPSALVGRTESRPTLVRFMMQGPVTAAMSCAESLEKEPAEWVVFYIDDLVTRDNAPDRRLRLCVQRRKDSAAAIFDQAYEPPVKGKPFALRGELEFRRWGGSFFSP